MAERSTFTSEEAAELQRLFSELQQASGAAMAAIGKPGMDSDEFRQAEQRAAKAATRIKEIRGVTGKHWTGL